MRETGEQLLLAAAQRHFAKSGFDGASLQQIADDAGMSKSSVLYHFESKEALYTAALRPVLDALRELNASLKDVGVSAGFVEQFVTLLFEHRESLFTLINHGQDSAKTLPVMVEADELIRDFGCRIEADHDDRSRLRFAFALAGAAFIVVGADRWKSEITPELNDEQFRSILTGIVAELIVPATSLATE